MRTLTCKQCGALFQHESAPGHPPDFCDAKCRRLGKRARNREDKAFLREFRRRERALANALERSNFHP